MVIGSPAGLNRDQADQRYVNIDDGPQTMRDTLWIEAAIARFALRSTSGDTAQMQWYVNDANDVLNLVADIFGYLDRLHIRHRHTDAVSGVDTTMDLRDDYIEVNKDIRAPATIASDDDAVLTSKGYVDHELSRISEGTRLFSGDLRVLKANASMAMDSSSGNSRFYMRDASNGVTNRFEIQSLSNRTLIRNYHRAISGDTRLEFWDTYVSIDAEFRGEPTVASSHDNAFVTKAYMETAMIEVDGDQSGIVFNDEGTKRGEIVADATYSAIIHYAADGVSNLSEIRCGPNDAVIRLDDAVHTRFFHSGGTNKFTVKAQSATDATEFELEGGGQTLRIGTDPAMSESYTLRMPSAKPTVGQVLTVDAVAGSLVTLKWETPT